MLAVCYLSSSSPGYSNTSLELVLRVLHRLRYLSEQAPFDAPSFGYAWPLIELVILRGGVLSPPSSSSTNDNVALTGAQADAEEQEKKLEQVSLALDIIKFHVLSYASPAFPRAPTLESLLHIMHTQPKLGGGAGTGVIEIGEAIAGADTRVPSSLLLSGVIGGKSLSLSLLAL